MQPSIRAEFEGIQLGDHRLNKRVLQMVEKMAARPTAPFPELFDAAELQGAYRLLDHEALTSEQVMGPHYTATVQRASVQPLVRMLHDGSNIVHGRGGKGRNFYKLGTNLYGYVSHVSLASTIDGVPLGIGHLMYVERDTDAPTAEPASEETLSSPAPSSETPPEETPSKKTPPEEAPSKETPSDEEKESQRWLLAVQQTAQRFEGQSLIHIMDSEANSYVLLAALLSQGHRFVIRGDERNVEVHPKTRWEKQNILKLLRQQPVLGERQVELSERTASDPRSKRNPNRKARTALLQMRSAKVYLPRPDDLRGTGPNAQPRRIQLNVVLVEERQAPEGEVPVQWILLTSEPVETLAEVEAVVDHYCGRWLIEELFKAVKTGCAFEKRQFEYQHTSQNALALTLPIAWQLLLLRAVERRHSSAPAKELLGEALPVLRAIAKRRLPSRPTVAHVMAAIAELGGHKKSNGPVGWLVLGRGMNRLREAVELAHRLRAAPQARELDL